METRDAVTFLDRFGGVADHYAAYRPHYPVELFDWLASVAPGRSTAWDCGAGSGQASVELARLFEHVIATDASKGQLERAVQHEHVEYRVATAEAAGLPSQTIDLVTVAQALHWFDLEKFYAEVRRVLVPRGVIAVWTYNLMEIDHGPIDQLVRDFYWKVAGPYWSEERRHVENGYREFAFPFEPIQSPPFNMRAEWPAAHVLGYISTWSATAKLIATEGSAPFDRFSETFITLWGDPLAVREIVWPLSVRAGRV